MRRFRYVISKVIYKAIAQNLPGSHLGINKLSWLLREWCARGILAFCGKGISIAPKAIISNKTYLGDKSSIGRACELFGEVHIGNGVLMAPEVIIMTQNHRYKEKNITILEQGKNIDEPVYIGNDVWLGRRAMIMPGSNIGTGCVVAAGAVVSGRIPDYCVVGGVPAKIIKQRE